jgi:hypothetical protein
MKKWKGIVFAFGFLWVGVLHADTIQSVPNGGIWSDTSTWVGKVVPGKNDTVLIHGTVSLDDSAMCRDLTIADSAILQNDTSSKHVTLAVTGSVTNNGTIQDNPVSYDLWLELYGNCTNNGIWTLARTFFASKDTQTIAQSPESEFGGALYKTNAAGWSDNFPLVAASDLTINAATFNCKGYSASTSSEYFRGALDMAGYNLELSGGTAFTGATLHRTGIVTCPDSAAISDCTFESNVTISGIVTVIDSKVDFNGEVTISGGTFQNGDTLDTAVVVRIKGNCTNFGNISNNPDGNELWLELYGDIYNAGTWLPARTHIASRKKQTISQIAQSKFEGGFFAFAVDSSTDTFPLVAASDLKFYNAEDFNCRKNICGLAREGKLDMAGFDLFLSGGTYLNGATVLRTKKITCQDSSMIGSCTFNDPVQACGNFQVAVQSVYFNDTLTVLDTLENGTGGCCVAQGILFALGGIVNKGVIRDNPKKFQLWCNIGRNASNSGTWVNAQNTLTDSVTQIVSLENGKPINAVFQFDGMWPSEPYAWQKDGQYLPGDTIRLLSLDSLDAASAGVYRCKHDTDWSRTITVLWDTTAGIGISGKRTGGMPSAFGCDIVVSRVAPVVRFWAPYVCGYTISIYDIRGRLVGSAGSQVSSGYHSVAIPRQGVPTGTYTISFRAAHFEKAMRVAIVR